jgi:peptidoglycan/LPS O-acetylase OafA/YrhL
MHKNNFDFLRLAFALFVIITHSYPLTGLPEADWLYQISNGQVSFSYLGVKGFFILSGYLIFQSRERSKGFIDYFWKRFVRLFPALIVVLVLTVLLGPFVYEGSIGSYLANRTVWTYIPNNLTLFRMQPGITGIFENNPYPSVINGSLWTIAYEFFCYCLIATLFFFKRKNTLAVTFYFLIFFFLKLFFYDTLSHYKFLLFAHHICELGTFFFGGALLAAVKIENSKHKNLIFSASLIILIASFFFNLFPMVHLVLLSPVVIIFGLSSTPYLTAIGKTIGDMSYGIYIYAFPVQQTLVYYFHMDYLNLMLYSTIITVILGYLSWHLIEKRALKLKKLHPKLLFSKGK